MMATELQLQCCLYTCNFGMDHMENRFQQFLYCCVMCSLSRKLVYRPSPSNGRLFWLCYPTFQVSCHIAHSLRLLILSSLQAYCHFFSWFVETELSKVAGAPTMPACKLWVISPFVWERPAPLPCPVTCFPEPDGIPKC
jgi:hypothetical protein